MKDVIEYSGYVKDGMLIIRKRKDFDGDVKRFEGKDIEIVVQKKRSLRSDPQNRYYWGVVVPNLMHGLNDTGNEMNKQETHEFIKANFCYEEKVYEETGEVVRFTKSTTRLTKSEFAEMTERVRRFSAMMLNVQIPEPNEDLKLTV